MKVLYIIDQGTIGGAIHSFMEMVVSLKHFGISPIVCTAKCDKINNILNLENIENVVLGHRTVLEPVSTTGVRWWLRYFKKRCVYYIMEMVALRRLTHLVDLNSVDLIHTNSARADLGCCISKKYGIPHVMHIREFADADFDCVSFKQNYIRMFNQYTDMFITISHAVKQHWINKGITSSKCITIYNGIDYDDITISSDKSKKKKHMGIVITGGVYETKGQHIAVEAVCILPAEIRENVDLDIIGWFDKKYVSHLIEMSKAYNNERHIHILGPKDDIHERLGNYQIGLMCSKAEGFGRVTAEYMHAKLGVIASNSGANPELIDDGVCGLLFNSGDAKSLADCIVRYYNDRDLLIRHSNASQKKAHLFYTQKKNAESIYELYKQILLQK